MVMWHIKLKGMSSRPLKSFTPGSNWWPWDGVKGSNTIRYLRERGDLRWRAIEWILVEDISVPLQLNEAIIAYLPPIEDIIVSLPLI